MITTQVTDEVVVSFEVETAVNALDPSTAFKTMAAHLNSKVKNGDLSTKVRVMGGVGSLTNVN